jgi:hypothetical protein
MRFSLRANVRILLSLITILAIVSAFMVSVVSTVVQICRQTWTKAVSLALKGSSLSTFLLYAERLSFQVMSVR